MIAITSAWSRTTVRPRNWSSITSRVYQVVPGLGTWRTSHTACRGTGESGRRAVAAGLAALRRSRDGVAFARRVGHLPRGGRDRFVLFASPRSDRAPALAAAARRDRRHRLVGRAVAGGVGRAPHRDAAVRVTDGL